MKKRFLIILWLLFLSAITFAQEHKYTVFYLSGSGQLINNKTETNIIKGTVIGKNQVIRLGENSYLLLFSESGSPVVLNKSGSYSYEKIRQIKDAAKESITASYFKYMWEEFTDKESNEEIKATGGVSRADILMKMPPDSCLVPDETVILTWNYPLTSKDIYLIFYDSSGNYLKAIPNHNTSYAYVNNNKSENHGPIIKWLISLLPDPGDDQYLYLFTFASSVQTKAIGQELQEFRKELVFDDVLNHVMLATFYEKHRLYLQEIDEFNNMLTKHPTNEVIKQQYDIFLKKHGINF